jgi:hypothetical protein
MLRLTPSAQSIAPRVGLIASAITTVCCLGVSFAVSIASTIGATFLTRDKTLEPLLAAALLVTVLGTALTLRRHRNPAPLIVVLAGAALVFAALYGPLDTGIGVTGAATGHGSHHAHDAMTDAMSTGAGGGGIGARALVWIGLIAMLVGQGLDVLLLRRRVRWQPAQSAGATVSPN